LFVLILSASAVGFRHEDVPSEVRYAREKHVRAWDVTARVRVHPAHRRVGLALRPCKLWLFALVR
jgi:hypothetical protein